MGLWGEAGDGGIRGDNGDKSTELPIAFSIGDVSCWEGGTGTLTLPHYRCGGLRALVMKEMG